MKKFIFLILSVGFITLLAGQAWAVTLDFVPSSQTVKVGDKVVVYLHVSGIGGYSVGPSVSSFDIDVGYGFNGHLHFKSAVYSFYLGDPSDPTETNINVIDYPEYSFVWVTEQSLLSSSDLNNRQGYTTTLVRLNFKAKQVGSYIISGDLYSLKDENGNELIGAHGPVGSAVVNVIKGKKDLPPSFP
jgi:hypothetical protein